MDFSMRRVNALFKKELKDIRRNKNVMMMCILPVIFCFIYSQISESDPKMGLSKMMVLTLCLGMNLVLTSSFVIAMLIAEEKEKNTLRTLMMSSVSPVEFLLGKALVTLSISILTNAIIFFMAGMDGKYFVIYLLLSSLVVISMLEFGAVIGLIAKNQMSTGVVGMPLVMALLMIPMFAEVNDTLKKIASFLPTYNLTEILDRIFKGKPILNHNIYGLAVIIAWIIGAGVIFTFTYSKKGLDK